MGEVDFNPEVCSQNVTNVLHVEVTDGADPYLRKKRRKGKYLGSIEISFSYSIDYIIEDNFSDTSSAIIPVHVNQSRRETTIKSIKTLKAIVNIVVVEAINVNLNKKLSTHDMHCKVTLGKPSK